MASPVTPHTMDGNPVGAPGQQTGQLLRARDRVHHEAQPAAGGPLWTRRRHGAHTIGATPGRRVATAPLANEPATAATGAVTYRGSGGR